MKHAIHISVLMLGVLLLNSCGKDSSCFKGTGNIIVEERAITSDILKVRVADNIDLVITQNSKASLTLQGGENLLPYVESDISGSELSLYSENKCGFFRDYNKSLVAYLSLPNIEHLIIEGRGTVTNTNQLNFDTFKIDAYNATGSVDLFVNFNSLEVRQHTGPADITITGLTNSLYAYTGGNGWFDFDELAVHDVHVNHDGSGDVDVFASNSLLIELTSIGNINYIGNPVVTISTHTGSGKINNNN